MADPARRVIDGDASHEFTSPDDRRFALQFLSSASASSSLAAGESTAGPYPVVTKPVSAMAALRWRTYVISKRAFDLVFSLTFLLLASPVWLSAFLLVVLTSPGPVIFRQTRCGQYGKLFTCYKFRTMVTDASLRIEHDERLQAQFAENWKLHADPRVTPVGQWLRKTSVDEVPQFVNILRGEMSVVGPRPVQVQELAEQYGPWGRVVFSVKPGLTGLWQVSGRSSLSYGQRITLDLEYVARRNFWFDLWLVLKTIPAVVCGRHAV